MTEAEIGDALRAAIERYVAGNERLWVVVNYIGHYARKLNKRDVAAAEQLRVLQFDLSVRAAVEDDGHKPGPEVKTMLADVRRLADELGA